MQLALCWAVQAALCLWAGTAVGPAAARPWNVAGRGFAMSVQGRGGFGSVTFFSCSSFSCQKYTFSLGLHWYFLSSSTATAWCPGGWWYVEMSKGQVFGLISVEVKCKKRTSYIDSLLAVGRSIQIPFCSCAVFTYRLLLSWPCSVFCWAARCSGIAGVLLCQVKSWWASAGATQILLYACASVGVLEVLIGAAPGETLVSATSKWIPCLKTDVATVYSCQLLVTGHRLFGSGLFLHTFSQANREQTFLHHCNSHKVLAVLSLLFAAYSLLPALSCRHWSLLSVPITLLMPNSRCGGRGGPSPVIIGDPHTVGTLLWCANSMEGR